MRAIFLPLNYIRIITVWLHYDMATARNSGFQFVDIESEKAEPCCQHD